MGTKIIETGSTAGGVAKVEYKDEAGNVLWYYDDAGNFVRNGNAKITGIAGTGKRMVVTDANGLLSASILSDVFIAGQLQTPTSTGININAGQGSMTIMAYASTSFGGGFATTSQVVMISCGYDGNNFTATSIATFGVWGTYGVEFSQISGILHVKCLGGSYCRIRLVLNR